VEHKIGFCTTSDGARIAYETFGHGTTIVIPPFLLGPVNKWDGLPDVRYVFENLARYHTIVLYDPRGAGLSERNRTDFTLESELQDVETVINHLKLDKVILDGSMWGGPTAVAYAAKYPKRVTNLILHGTYAYYGKFLPDEVKSSILSLLRQQNNWLGLRSFLSLMFPQASTDEIALYVAIYSEITTPENFARIMQMRYTLDVTNLCLRVKAPTIVIHFRGDLMIDFNAGLELASLIPNARFVPLEGIFQGAHAGDSLLRAKFEFLGDPVGVDKYKESALASAKKPEHDVFISFALPDKQAAARIYACLKSNGISPFWCEDLTAGQDYPQLLGEAVRNSKSFLLVVSNASDNSATVRKETTIAHNNKKPIIPVRIEDILPKNLEYLIANSLFFDAFPQPLEQHLPRLTSDIKKIVGSKTAKKGKTKK
jgi:pimeloyl-ACP methyl ester carboxylesterase